MTKSTAEQISPLRAVREAQGLGLNETARLAGLDPSHLSRIELGQAGLTVPTLMRLARVLELRQLERLLSQYRREDGQ